MSMMTMCPACGSDWCSNCECVRDRYRRRVKALEDALREAVGSFELLVNATVKGPQYDAACADVARLKRVLNAKEKA
jgi:hypothetical protein